jgi:hypothetical protein
MNFPNVTVNLLESKVPKNPVIAKIAPVIPKIQIKS